MRAVKLKPRERVGLGESLQCLPCQSWCCITVQNFEFVSPGRPDRVYEGEVEGSVTMLQHSKYRGSEERA